MKPLGCPIRTRCGGVSVDYIIEGLFRLRSVGIREGRKIVRRDVDSHQLRKGQRWWILVRSKGVCCVRDREYASTWSFGKHSKESKKNVGSAGN